MATAEELDAAAVRFERASWELRVAPGEARARFSSHVLRGGRLAMRIHGLIDRLDRSSHYYANHLERLAAESRSRAQMVRIAAAERRAYLGALNDYQVTRRLYADGHFSADVVAPSPPSPPRDPPSWAEF